MAKKTQHFNPRQNMNGDTYEVFHYLDMASRHLEAHYHEFYEVYFFIDGEVDYWIEGSVYHLKAGDILLIDSMELHKPVPRSNAERYERIVLWINRSYLSSVENGALEGCFRKKGRLLRLGANESRYLHTLARRLVEEFYSEEKCSQSCAYGLLLQVLVALTRQTESATDHGGESYSTPTFITDILSYIGKNYRQNLTLDHLASHFFINKYYLSHEFRKAVGTGVHRYIILKRLHYAYDALLAGEPAGEVAIQSGFSDYTAFYKAFKAEYGISPTACLHQSNT